MKTNKIFLFLLLLLPSLTTWSQTIDIPMEDRNKVIGARVKDVGRYLKNTPGFIAMGDYITQNINRILPSSLTFKLIHSVFFYDMPKGDETGQEFPTMAFGQLASNGRYVFVKVDATRVNGIIDTKVGDIIPLSSTHFSIEVGLKDRKVVLTDSRNDIKIVFPTGVGSLEDGVLYPGQTTLLTPRFKKAYINKSTIISQRTVPTYFAGEPFIRITTNENVTEGHTPIGFHVQPNKETFIRGFESHGCMRLPLAELKMFHDLVMHGPHQRLDITVSFNIEDESDHPFPKRNNPYMAVVNTGSASNPDFKIDRDGLIQTDYVYKEAPVESFYDQEEDQFHKLFNYDVDWRLQAKYSKCRKAGGNNRSCRNKVYGKKNVFNFFYRCQVHKNCSI